MGDEIVLTRPRICSFAPRVFRRDGLDGWIGNIGRVHVSGDGGGKEEDALIMLLSRDKSRDYLADDHVTNTRVHKT